MSDKRRISSFSALLLMAAAAVTGLACANLLKIQYVPATPTSYIKTSFTMDGASAEIVESEVTSRIEAALSRMPFCAGVSSTSYEGAGVVKMKLRKGTDVQTARFEAASQIRGLYPSLPAGCSYPTVSPLSESNRGSRSVVTYCIRSSSSSETIGRFAENILRTPLSMIDGVSSVTIGGWSPREWAIVFDQKKASSLGVSADDIADAFATYSSEYITGVLHEDGDLYVMKTNIGGPEDFMGIPVSSVNGKIVLLADIATAKYQESPPDSYYRLNGLNTVFLSVEASSDSNILTVEKKVKDVMAELCKTIPAGMTVSISYDYAEYIRAELRRIFIRTCLCIIILLLLVLVVSKSWRYTLIILLTMSVNILISISIYAITKLPIHIYTLAGITVSLGIIIDNSIVMVDHYSRTRNRTVFPAILSSVLTTVAALSVIILLPEKDKANLIDFSKVIAVNLSVSLLVSYLFVPALVDYFPIQKKDRPFGTKDLSEAVSWNALIDKWRHHYGSYIEWGINHKWVLVLASVILVGIPTCVLPQRYSLSAKDGTRQIGRTVDRILSSSFGLFYRSLAAADFYREPERPVLCIHASMPEGNIIGQLNDAIMVMENYLCQFEGIESFETRISSSTSGTIHVFFNPNVEMSEFPSFLKSDVIKVASNLGGANWTVSGINDNDFNNNILSDYRTYRIELEGYNYPRLKSFADTLARTLSANNRVSNVEIWGGDTPPLTQYSLDYDFERLTASAVSPYLYYSSLFSPLYNGIIGSSDIGGSRANVRLESSAANDYDYWHILNSGVERDSSRIKLSTVGTIRKNKSGVVIERNNQSYHLSVRFGFTGNDRQIKRVTGNAVEHMNENVLPVGFKASVLSSGGWFGTADQNYAYLIILVIIMVFIILTIHFESIYIPLAILWMIPISFSGLFLTFGLFDVPFDKGGLAAFIMLCGIVVNAGIYMANEFTRNGDLSVGGYLRAYSNKIIPIMLTISSSVLGLVPFLFDGPSEVFWFSFACGTIGGLIFSIPALILFLPVGLIHRKNFRSERTNVPR